MGRGNQSTMKGKGKWQTKDSARDVYFGKHLKNSAMENLWANATDTHQLFCSQTKTAAVPCILGQ